jgi:hypothetical protein
VAAARKASRYFRSAICQQGDPPPAAKSPPSIPCRAPPRPPRAQAVSRRPPHRPPRVYSVRQRFSAPAHGTRRGQIERGGSAGLRSTFQRHGTQHLLHYWSPSSFHLVPVCRQLQRAYYLDLARARAHRRSVPSGFVQRTGCSACGLGYPHQVWWAPPMYIARAWAR